MMAREKTKTPGVYKTTGKKGRVKYRLYVNVQIPDPLSASGFRWKLVGKTYSSYQDAVDAKIKTQSEVKSGKYVEPTDATVKELVTAWLEAGKTRGVSKRGPWKIQSYLSHQMQFNRHIAPKLGDVKASKLRKSMIEQAAAEWSETVSARTTNKLLATLNAAYKFGLKDPDRFGIKANPLETVERLVTRKTPNEIEALSLGEIADHGEDRPEPKLGALREIQPGEVYTTLELKKIVNGAAPGLEKTLLTMAIFTGLRHGEINAVRWSSIDFKRKTLTVNRSMTQLSKKRGGPILDRPKTRNAYRILELPAPLLAELKRWKLQCPPNANDLVMVDELGKPTQRKENNERLKACAERAGVRPLCMNNLRHSFASQQLIHGTTPLEVSYLMGHSSPAVTLSIYSHWAKGEKSRAQERLAQSIMAATEEGLEEAQQETV
jgi:integrase